MISKELKDNEQDSGITDRTKVNPISNISTQEVFSLLEERLMVELTQRKIGEIVVRKEIETQLVRVQVPIRREKLIIEQVSPEYQLIAEIDLGQTTNSDDATIYSTSDTSRADNDRDRPISIESDDPTTRLNQQSTQPTVYGSTNSLRAASDLFNYLANLPTENCGVVQIEIALRDSRHLDTYQTLVDRYFQS